MPQSELSSSLAFVYCSSPNSWKVDISKCEKPIHPNTEPDLIDCAISLHNITDIRYPQHACNAGRWCKMCYVTFHTKGETGSGFLTPFPQFPVPCGDNLQRTRTRLPIYSTSEQTFASGFSPRNDSNLNWSCGPTILVGCVSDRDALSVSPGKGLEASASLFMSSKWH